MKFVERITDLERGYVNQVMDEQFRTSSGSMMSTRLEQVFAEKFDSKFAIAFDNGTATLHAALHAAGVGEGDEVIVPPLTMASTTFCVEHCNALPVFADIDPYTWSIDPSSIEKCITERTKAIVPVSIFGMPMDMDPIMELAEQYGLFVLEDDAQCFQGYYKGKIMGSIGHASSFSFQSSKHLTSGEGGIITTNDEELALNIRRFNSLGYAAVGAGKGKITRDTIQSPTYKRHASVGFNYRIPELCAAVALGQVERMDELNAMRKTVAQMYAEELGGCSWLVPQAKQEGYENAYWAYVLRIDGDDAPAWQDFRNEYVKNSGEGIYGCWSLTYLEPVYYGNQVRDYQWQVFGKGLCPIAESVQPRLLQFKTNYYSEAEACAAAQALGKTIRHFAG